MRVRTLILALGTFAIGTDAFVVAGVLSGIARGTHSNIGSAGLLVTAFALCYGLSAPVLTVSLSRYPRRTVLVAALSGLAAANVLAAAASGYGVIFLARVLAAAAAAAYSPVALATAVQISSPEQRAGAVATVLAGLTVALVVGVPLGSLLGSLGSWRWTFALVAALAGVAAVGVRVLFPPVAAVPSASLKQRLALLRHPAIVANLAATYVWLAGAMVTYTYITVVLQHATGWHGTAISGLLLLYGTAAFVGNWLGGRSADRWGGKRCVIVGLAAALPAFALMGLAAQEGPPAGVAVGVIALAVWGVAGWSLTPSQSQRLITAAPDAGAEILSLNTSAIYLGMATGAAVGGRVIAHADVANLGYLAAVLQGVSLVLVLLTPISPLARTAARGGLAAASLIEH